MPKFYKILALLLASIFIHATATADRALHNANSLLMKGDYIKAAKAFEHKAITAENQMLAIRYNSISEILYTHPDGKYYLSSAFPSGASLLNPDSYYLKPGTIDLKSPLAMQAALRDKAVNQVMKAQEIIAKSEKLISINHESAERTLETANQHLVQANILNPGIASTYYVDIAGLQVKIHRKRSRILANQFDISLAILDSIDPDSHEYREHVLLLLEKIEDITEELEAIITLSDKHEKQFKKIGEISRRDYEMIWSIRQTLVEDLKRLEND